MDKAIIENIFEPFFTTKDKNMGTGLGLASVYGAVKQNDGFIDVYSEPGVGTTFKIYLPGHTAEDQTLVMDKPEEIPLGSGETVLLVEDEPGIMKMGQIMLQRLGYEVLVADSPAGALTQARDHGATIHLLITDVVMPEMNGRRLAEAVESICPEIKVLYMSGYTADVIVHHGVLDKGLHFIEKPFSIRELAAKIRHVL
jgi:CheY-like chemotaxis protein